MKETLNSKKGCLYGAACWEPWLYGWLLWEIPEIWHFVSPALSATLQAQPSCTRHPLYNICALKSAGLIAGAFIISMATGEYRSTAGSSPMIRFLLGIITMIGALVFLGCPLRMVIRMAAGDLNAYMGLIGFVLGVGTGCIF